MLLEESMRMYNVKLKDNPQPWLDAMDPCGTMLKQNS